MFKKSLKLKLLKAFLGAFIGLNAIVSGLTSQALASQSFSINPYDYDLKKNARYYILQKRAQQVLEQKQKNQKKCFIIQTENKIEYKCFIPGVNM